MIAFHTWFFSSPLLSLMIWILKIPWMEKKEIGSHGEKTKRCQLSFLKQESTAGNYSFSISCSLPGNYIIFDGYILDSLFPLWNTGHFTHFWRTHNGQRLEKRKSISSFHLEHRKVRGANSRGADVLCPPLRDIWANSTIRLSEQSFQMSLIHTEVMINF